MPGIMANLLAINTANDFLHLDWSLSLNALVLRRRRKLHTPLGSWNSERDIFKVITFSDYK